MGRMAKWKFPILFLVIGSGLAIIRHSTVAIPSMEGWHSLVQTPVKDKTFINEKVELDGHEFQDCTFENVSFEFDGIAPFSLEHCNFIGTWKMATSNVQFGALAVLMRELKMTNTNVPILYNNKVLPQ
jgi:hypothetical protein